MKSIITFLLFGTLLLITTSGGPVEAVHVFVYDYENVLGTSLQLKIAAVSENSADRSEEVALKEIDRLAKILSTYDPQSEVSQWLRTRNEQIRLSSELFEVLRLFEEWSQKSSGALNASAAIASKLWRDAESSQTIPNKEQLLLAVAQMNAPQWRLNDADQSAIHLTNDPIVLNSFVKSYILQKTLERVMGNPGVQGVFLNIGGDIALTGWQQETVGITNPLAAADNDQPLMYVKLNGQAIATSGNYRRGYRINNQWYSHIIDPRTALPANKVVSATVIADNPTDAGALATAFNVLEPEESVKLASSFPDVKYCIVTTDARTITSANWNKVEVAVEPSLEPTNGQTKLNVSLELARFEGTFRRPFVAVWVENSDKESVRTLAVWYNKPRWLPDLKRWYSKNQAVVRDWNVMGTVSSATRSAGRYTLSWDGLDDKGNPVPQGTYTIYLEAAREHGTYQLIKQEINWNNKLVHFEMKGGVEITAATLDIVKL